MNGVPELLILQLLSAQEMYGYQLVRAIEEATGERIKLGEGVVYPALHTLERRGQLRARRKSFGGRTRIYYTATAAGKKRLKALVDNWSAITNALAEVINGGQPTPSLV